MVTFRINGANHSLDVDNDVPLLWVLRDELTLTGTKYGCGVAQCGACTVHLDGRAARSCVTPAASLAGREVVTIEGVSGQVAQAVQDAWRELDADWAQVKVEAAPADATRYNNLKLGPMQATGGSTSLANSWEQLRRAGATARAMLVEAAAQEWSVPAAEIIVDRGVVSHPPSGRQATFGELASKAAILTPPTQVTLKDPKDFKLVGKVVRRAAKVIEAIYEFPYLAHAPMEPLDAVVRVGADGCDYWAGSQLQTIDQAAIARTLGLPPEKVRVHTLLAGGSFGRRGTFKGDVAGEAAAIAKAIGRDKTVKLVWTREDDIQGGKYRPLYVHRLRAGLDAQANIIGWEHRIVGQSLMAGTPFERALVKNGVDGTSVEGAANLPYDIPNLTVELHTTQVGVPVHSWRSVGSTHTAYSTETFLDEFAHAAGRDPLEVRRALLAKHPRHLGTLNLAAEKAGWGEPLPAGRARGVAVQEAFDPA